MKKVEFIIINFIKIGFDYMYKVLVCFFDVK